MFINKKPFLIKIDGLFSSWPFIKELRCWVVSSARYSLPYRAKTIVLL